MASDPVSYLQRNVLWCESFFVVDGPLWWRYHGYRAFSAASVAPGEMLMSLLDRSLNSRESENPVCRPFVTREFGIKAGEKVIAPG